MLSSIILFLKGVAMGAANVIPGVSGGTIAFVTGIYEEFIHSLKSFDIQALKLLLSFKLKEFAAHVNLKFLTILFLGVAISIVSLGKLLDYLFEQQAVYVWAFFFGLILASVYFVGKTIQKWSVEAMFMLLVGVAAAVLLAFAEQAEENTSFVYLFICGVVAISSMILPGLSGSFVLIIMGNYSLIMLRTIPNLTENLSASMKILLPFALGAAVGFILLSRVISFLLKKFKDVTLAVLTGFIFGSLLTIWPWKEPLEFIIKSDGSKHVTKYAWNMPLWSETSTYIALILILIGIVVVYALESLGKQKS